MPKFRRDFTSPVDAFGSRSRKVKIGDDYTGLIKILNPTLMPCCSVCVTVTFHHNIKFNAKATLRAYHIYNSLRAFSVVFRILHTGLSLRIYNNNKPSKRSNLAAGLSCKQTISFCVQLSASPPRTQWSKKCNRNPNSPGLFLTVLNIIFNPSVCTIGSCCKAFIYIKRHF